MMLIEVGEYLKANYENFSLGFQTCLEDLLRYLKLRVVQKHRLAERINKYQINFF